MKLAYHGATHMKSDLVTDIAVSAEAGFRSIELWAEKLDQFLFDKPLSTLKSVLLDHDVEATSINSIEFIGFRGDEYEQVRRRCQQLSEIAEEINCPMIVVVPSPTPQSRKKDGRWELDFPWESIVTEYATVLQDLGALAGKHGVKLTFEFIGFGWSSVRTPRGAMEIIQKANCPNVGMTFDACHFYAGGGSLEEINHLNPDKIYTFHINDMEDVPKESISDALRLLPGTGVIPLNDICKRLKQIKYDGLCSIELFRPDYWDWQPLALAKEARTMALKVLEPHFDIE